MPKKTSGRGQSKAQRRAVRRNEPGIEEAVSTPEPVPAAAPATSAPAAPAAPARYAARAAVGARRPSPSSAPIAIDYTYVRNDLTRIGVLVGIIVVVLVALTFVLR